MLKFYENAVRWHYALSYLDPLRALKIERAILRRKNDKNKSKPPDRIFVIFTADTEYTPPWNSGSWMGIGSDPINRRGLDIIQGALSLNSVKGTFLLEGILAKNDPEVVENLAGKGHEIGYHGFAHESFGGPWRTSTVEQPQILKREQVPEKIESGKEIIESLTGKKPESFVAPFHHVRKSTLKVLGKEGFCVDSSLYNHVYGAKDPFEIRWPSGSIIEIPFAVPLRPKWRMRMTPFFPTILEAAEENFEETVEDIQIINGSDNSCICLLLTCHPWEFSAENDARSKTLQKFLNYFVRVRKAETVTMSEFPRYFRKEFNEFSSCIS